MYVDGFVMVVQKNKVKAYEKMASEAGKSWKKHGALQYFECVGDDLNPKGPAEMKTLTFPQVMKLKKNETAFFSFIVFKSKSHRDSVNKKVMKEMSEYYNDPKHKKTEMPFDMKKVAYGGFKALVKL